MAKQNEAVPEGEHRVYGTDGEGDSLFSSKGFSPGSSEKGAGRASKPGEGKTLFPGQIFPGGGRFHIE